MGKCPRPTPATASERPFRSRLFNVCVIYCFLFFSFCLFCLFWPCISLCPQLREQQQTKIGVFSPAFYGVEAWKGHPHNHLLSDVAVHASFKPKSHKKKK